VERDLIVAEIGKIDKQLEIVERQIQNSDYNIAGLIQQKTRHMDRQLLLETKKAELQAELAELPEPVPEGE
jgi:chromosome segregation ATPase